MQKNFEAMFKEIKVKYAAKCRINILPFHGFTTNASKIFLKVMTFLTVLCLKNLDYKMSVNPNKFIIKSKLTTI
jgi:hypothetical protein